MNAPRWKIAEDICSPCFLGSLTSESLLFQRIYLELVILEDALEYG